MLELCTTTGTNNLQCIKSLPISRLYICILYVDLRDASKQKQNVPCKFAMCVTASKRASILSQHVCANQPPRGGAHPAAGPAFLRSADRTGHHPPSRGLPHRKPQ